MYPATRTFGRTAGVFYMPLLLHGVERTRDKSLHTKLILNVFSLLLTMGTETNKQLMIFVSNESVSSSTVCWSVPTALITPFANPYSSLNFIPLYHYHPHPALSWPLCFNKVFCLKHQPPSSPWVRYSVFFIIFCVRLH